MALEIEVGTRFFRVRLHSGDKKFHLRESEIVEISKDRETYVLKLEGGGTAKVSAWATDWSPYRCSAWSSFIEVLAGSLGATDDPNVMNKRKSDLTCALGAMWMSAYGRGQASKRRGEEPASEISEEYRDGYDAGLGQGASHGYNDAILQCKALLEEYESGKTEGSDGLWWLNAASVGISAIDRCVDRIWDALKVYETKTASKEGDATE